MIDVIYNLYTRNLNLVYRLHLNNIPKVKGFIYAFYSALMTFIYRLDDLKGTKAIEGTVPCDTEEEIVVSLTTYPKRINEVYFTLKSILRQKMKPNRIVLWLAEEEFPQKEIDLPKSIIKLKHCGLDIQFCDNLRSHKKYYYAMKRYPNSIIITLDDDVFYPSDLIEELIIHHKQYPKCIVCTRGHIMTTNNGAILSYSEWISNPHTEEKPQLMICPTGVGGVLYPPYSLNSEVFEKESIKELCPYADDLWLRVMGLIEKTEVVKLNKYRYTFLAVGNSQTNRLSNENVINSKNDQQLENLLAKYGYLLNIM